jgi:hypothetical protein
MAAFCWSEGVAESAANAGREISNARRGIVSFMIASTLYFDAAAAKTLKSFSIAG